MKKDTKMTMLERALYYEVQYRNAIVSDSLSFFDVNLTENLIENDFFIKDRNGKPISCLGQIDLSAPCKFTDFLNRWYDIQIPDEIKSTEFNFFPNLRENLLKEFDLGKREFSFEYWSYDLLLNKIYVSQKFYLTKNEEGDICALVVVRDITQQKNQEEEALNKKMSRYAFQDMVTGGYNYNRFKHKLNSLNVAGSIIALDIHSFKIINTICGVTTGDAVLKTIHECLMTLIRKEENELMAHIHADHFIIYTPTADPDKIIAKLKNYTLALSLISVELDVPQVLPYFGIAKWNPGKRIELSYSEAVASKQNARGLQSENYSFFNEEDTSRIIEEQAMSESFDEAIEKNDFKIWYQPKYNPVTKKLVGAEALVRWLKPDGSLVPPGKFIPLFERNGKIRILDEYVFRQVCQQQKIWQNIGKQIVPVSINLSRASLYYKTVVNQYKLISEDIGIEKEFIPIEITESAAVNNNIIETVANQFYSNGFHLHMDDFGSGYSSLATLNQLHFDTLKLDKSLIDFIGNFGGDRLLEHTISLAKELGMHVTAEGVENVGQVNFLKHNGCDSIQGYFYSRPVPVDEFETQLESISENENNGKTDFISDYIADFRRYYIKPPVYTFIVNLSKNSFEEIYGSSDWKNETKISEVSYTNAVNYLAQNFIEPEYRQAYLNFMEIENAIESMKNHQDTRMISYRRKFNGNICNINLLYYTFRVQETGDYMGFITVTQLD